MSGSLSPLQSSDRYLNDANSECQRFTSAGADQVFLKRVRRVLIVEFRDEVYSDLKCLFESLGWEVSRAVSGANVAHQVNQTNPHLLIANEAMPYESGWLIACKLSLIRNRLPIWLYDVRNFQRASAYKECCGVEQVIAYRGGVTQLLIQLRDLIHNWMKPGTVASEKPSAA